MQLGDLITTETDVLKADKWVFDTLKSVIPDTSNFNINEVEDGEKELIVGENFTIDPELIRILKNSPFIVKNNGVPVLTSPSGEEKPWVEWFESKKYKYILTEDI